MATLSIVHLTTFLQGGAGRAIAHLASAQRRAGHDVLVVTSATGEDGYGNYPHHIERLRADGVPLLTEDSLFKRDSRLNLRVLERLRGIRSADDVDVVHAHAGVPARVGRLFATQTRRPIAVVQTQHGWGTTKTADQARDDLAVLQDVDRAIVTSEASATWLAQRGVPRDHLIVIPCGLPAEMPPDPGAEPRNCVEALRVGRRSVIGCVGSVNANKNQRLVLEALAQMPGRDVAAVFIGEGGESLMAAARRLSVDDRVYAAGYRPDADRWMRLFDLLVVPSLTEGQGLVVLEAFRAGVPVVASDIAPLRELVTHGETGWLFDPGRAESLADAIQHALTTQAEARRAIVPAARRRFLDRYTVEAMVTRHEALYRRLLVERTSLDSC